MARTSAILKANEKHMRKTGMILFLYLLVITLVYPMVVETGFGYWDVATLIFLSGLNTFTELFLGITYQTFMAASQRSYVGHMFGIISKILSTAVQVIMLKTGFSIQMVKLAGASVFFVKLAVYNWYIPRKYHIDRHCEPDPTALDKRWDATGHAVANIIHNKTDIIVLTLFCDVKIVSVYTVYSMVLHMLEKAKNILTPSTESFYGDMWNRGETDKIKKALELYEYVMNVFTSVVIPATLVLILPFISLYVKGVKDVEYMLPSYAVISTVAAAFLALRSPHITLTHGAGFYKETKAGAYLEAGINIVLSVVLAQFFGIVGVGIGTLAANVFRTVQYMLFVDKHIVPRGMLVPLKKILWSGANVTVTTLLLYTVLGRIAYGSWTAWVLCGFISVAAGAAVTLLSSAIFYRNDLKEAVTFVKNMLRRKKK